MLKIIFASLLILLPTAAGQSRAGVENAALYNNPPANAQKGTITTIKFPITKNVKVYRKVNSKSVKNSQGVLKTLTTTTTTVTTTTRRVTVIKKVLTKAKPKKGRSKR